jgi:hypothetical protein
VAIKIIGTSNIARQTCCGNCGSVLEYLPVDIEEKIVRDYAGWADSESYLPLS